MPLCVPELPPGMDSWDIDRGDGTQTKGVEVPSAAKLLGLRTGVLEEWVASGRVEIVMSPTRERLVLIDSLWAAIPPDVRD